jgi:hypothetical protein
MTDAPISPLRRRMIEDVTVRKLAARTQEGYKRPPSPSRHPTPAPNSNPHR